MANKLFETSISSKLRPHIGRGGLMRVSLLIVGILEGVWGLMQLCGAVESGHPRYPVTGSFYNPGPFGCFIGCLLPLAAQCFLVGSGQCQSVEVCSGKVAPKAIIVKWVAGAYILVCAVLLPGGMSRTGWVAALAGCGVVAAGLYGDRIRNMARRKRAWLFAGIAAAALLCGAGAYALKPDSAAGRLLMWKIALDTAASGPAWGVGWENVAGAYGNAQEAYFASGAATAREEMLAGTPAYVFNEYLQIAIAYGPAAGVAFIVSLLVPGVMYWRRGEYGLAGVAVALMAVCFASYPLQFWEFKLLIGTVVAGGLMLLRGNRARAAAVAAYLLLWGGVCLKSREVDISGEFSKAQRAQNIGHHEESNRILQSILPKTSDPMPLNLMGKNYQALGMRDSAQHCFSRAALRVPNRLYPHYLLMNLYAESPADSLQMLREAQILLTKQPKTHSTAIDEMRREADSRLRR